MNTIFETPYLIELLTPRHTNDDLERRTEVFAERYRRIVDACAVASIPDNPMGNVHLTAIEAMDHVGLPFEPKRTLLHLNSFHLKSNIETYLRTASDRGLTRLLIIGGDGNPELPRLHPSEIGVDAGSVTSVELLEYIHREFPGVFTCGVAFNQYSPATYERERLLRKIDAGARFVITQPAIGEDSTVATLRDFGLPVFVGAWMSKRTDLLMECVGMEAHMELQYNPLDNLALLDRAYPEFGLYLALLSFGQDWTDLLVRRRSCASCC